MLGGREGRGQRESEGGRGGRETFEPMHIFKHTTNS